jgi:hypothetical protein
MSFATACPQAPALSPWLAPYGINRGTRFGEIAETFALAAPPDYSATKRYPMPGTE